MGSMILDSFFHQEIYIPSRIVWIWLTPNWKFTKNPQIKTNKSTQNPKNFTFLSSLQSPVSTVQSVLISASLWFSALRLSQVSTAHLTVSGSEVQESGINIWAYIC